MKQEGVEADFESWKWISLRKRRRFVFILLNISLCGLWTSQFLTRHYHLNNTYHDLFIHSAVCLILALHAIIFLLIVCDSRLQSIIEFNDRQGKGLVHAVVVSLLLVVLLNVGMNSIESSNLFELSFTLVAVTIIFPRLLHNVGYCKNQIAFYFGLLFIHWFVLWWRFDHICNVSVNFWIMLLSVSCFCVVDISIQEREYQFFFDSFKSSINSKEKEQNFDFQDIISSVDTVVNMINQLEFDIRYRISRGLEFYSTHSLSDKENNMEREKQILGAGCGKGAKSPFSMETSKPSLYRSAIKVGSASLKAHHQGYLYHIETLCEAISISLRSDINSAFCEDSGGSFYLSELIENVFLSFEDIFLPRVVPLFFDSAFGDLYVQKTSRKCLETIVFLILYDSIYGKNPGFCSVSFQCQKHGGIGHKKKVQIVITKCSNSSHHLRSNSSPDDNSDQPSRSKHMRDFSTSYSDSPQILLADRLAFQHLNTRVCGSGPHQNGELSTLTWRLDISSLQTQQHDERIPQLCDLKENLYQWKLFHDSSCTSADLHIYQGFKNTLTKLGVSFTVGDAQGNVDSHSRRNMHKICVVHERVLNKLTDAKLQLLVSKAANVLILVDVELDRRDAAFFGVRQFTPHFRLNCASIAASSFNRRSLPEAFCRLVRLQVNSNVTAADFVNQFKEFRVEPKYVEAVEQSPRAAVLYISPKSSVRMQPSSVRMRAPSFEVYAEKDAVYLNAVGVTISISSCWYQMLQDWRIDPNGYPRLLQMMQLFYGSDHTSSGAGEEPSELRNIDSDDDNYEEVKRPAYTSNYAASEDSLTRSASNSSWRSRVDTTRRVCSFDTLRNIALRQPQQREFEKIEKQFSELFSHACLTVHTIDKIIRHAKMDCLPKELPSFENYSTTDIYDSSTAKTGIHKSLLTIVNNTAYGSSGGGIIYSYFLARFLKPLAKLRVLLTMFERSEDQEIVTKAVLQEHLLNDVHRTLDHLIDQSVRDNLHFLSTWFGNIQALLSENLKKCRMEAVKTIPMMLDIAENVLWGISDCC